MTQGSEPVSPLSAVGRPLSRQAADDAMVSTLEAMRRSSGRYRRLVLKLVSVELRCRRTAGTSRPPKTLPETPAMKGAPVVAPAPAASGVPSTARDEAFRMPKSEKQHGVEMSPKRPLPIGAKRPAPRPARPPMTGEERGSLAAWSTLLALAVIAFFTWSPPRPGRRGAETVVGVVLPASDDPADLSTEALARQPLATIVEVADSRDAAARGRMIAALVRRGAAQELVGLAGHPTAGVRGAVPLALSSLGLVPSEQAGEYASRLLSPVDAVRELAARELVIRVGRGREEIARGL